MIEKVTKSEQTSNIETWHRFRRGVQLKCNRKSRFKRILEKKIRQLKWENTSSME